MGGVSDVITTRRSLTEGPGELPQNWVRPLREDSQPEGEVSQRGLTRGALVGQAGLRDASRF